MVFSNIYTLFRAQTAKYRDLPVFYTRVGDGWSSQPWNAFEEQVLDAACGLLAKGLSKGASVAILAGNIPEWSVIDIAAIAAGGVGVGIYPTSSVEQCAYISSHSEAEFIFVDTLNQLSKIAEIGSPLPSLKGVICIEPPSEQTTELLRSEGPRLFFGIKSVLTDEIPVTAFSDLLAVGRSKREELMPIVHQLGRAANPDDIAIMVYTSGTTGEPKGAMLSHRYILNSIESLRQSVPIFDSDIAFSYLPGCHVAERISGIYNRLYNGTPAYFVDDLTKLYHYMLDVKPTVFASLPRFFEKIHASIVAKHGDHVTPEIVNKAFGGRMRLLTSGGAPLPNEIAQFFAGAGLPILQAYGLTENICVAFNTVAEHRFGTVGKPMPMCEVKIADDGEILVKSPMMFSGYYKAPDRTAEMFNDDGWLKTGDLGMLDEDRFLKITGRKKEIIVLSSGKNVAPALVENLVKESHLISQCMVYGDRKSYCVALITVNEAEAANMCVEQIHGLVEQSVARANARLSNSEQIKRWIILDRDFSAEFDEVTPTLKLKRRVVADHYKAVLEKLYEN
ncbi:MAG: AMP-binding protein [Pyrinomonadaceae bacterium]